MNTIQNLVHGVGLGLRRPFLAEILHSDNSDIDFFEVAPENWMTTGGKVGKQFSAMTEKHAFICHGLSLSIGSTDPLDENFLLALKKFMQQHRIKFYSEHLSYCSHNGHLYDLMPVPFIADAIPHIANRIKRVQDILEQRIALENVSYYAAPSQEMSEIDFFNAIIHEADCDVLLDINNIYVNSINHQYDAETFLRAIPAQRIAYAHIAGHYVAADDFLIDTHGATVVDPVWRLLAKAYELYGVFPTLLERDFNLPPLSELRLEVQSIRNIQHAWNQQHAQQTA